MNKRRNDRRVTGTSRVRRKDRWCPSPVLFSIFAPFAQRNSCQFAFIPFSASVRGCPPGAAIAMSSAAMPATCAAPKGTACDSVSLRQFIGKRSSAGLSQLSSIATPKRLSPSNPPTLFSAIVPVNAQISFQPDCVARAGAGGLGGALFCMYRHRSNSRAIQSSFTLRRARGCEQRRGRLPRPE